MFEHLLPLGSVVQLKHGMKRLLVVGRVVSTDDNVICDYAGVLYPEGLIDSESLYLFNDSNIERVYSVGFQDQEEAAFKQVVLSGPGGANEGDA